MKLNAFVFLFLSVLVFSSCSSRFDYKISEKNFENGEQRYALVDSCGTAVTPYVYTEISEESEISGLRRLCFEDSTEVYLDKRGEAFFKVEKESDIDKTNEDFVFEYDNTNLIVVLYLFSAIALVWFLYCARVEKVFFLPLLVVFFITFAVPTNWLVERNKFEGYELVTNKIDNLYGLEQNGKLVLDVVYSDAMDYDKMITMLRTGDNKRIFIDVEQNMFVKAGSVDDVEKYVISAYDYNRNVSVLFVAIPIGLVVLLIASICCIVKKW